MAEFYMSLGSNLGDRFSNLKKGIKSLRSKGLHIVSVSSIYETEPVDMPRGNSFYNLVVKAQSALSPDEVLHACFDVESHMGRVRAEKKEPRFFDADILFYDDLIFESESLTIPHPRLHLRKFVLVPLAEIAPDLIHPILKKSVSALLYECPDNSKVMKVNSVLDCL